MILRFLNIQGIAGLAASFALAILLLVQRHETSHWKRQSAHFEQLYQAIEAAFAGTVANVRAAADSARAADRANAAHVAAAQVTINERTAHDLEARLADARARAGKLRVSPASAATDRGPGRAAPMPGLPIASGRAAQAAGEDRLSASDALIATEQAIQLDELIMWVRQQHDVRLNREPGERGTAAGDR